MVALDVLIAALKASWGSDTCFEPGEWSRNNPSRGQCVSSSLVVQDYLGGELVRYKVEINGGFEMHYCNLVKGMIIDTTAMQYDEPVSMRIYPVDLNGYGSVREKRLSDELTKKKYITLKERVEKRLNKL
jgi:hypothetical protein